MSRERQENNVAEKASLKRRAEEDAEISCLGKDPVYIEFILCKKLLAEKSPVFRHKLAESSQQMPSGEDEEYLDIGECSMQAYTLFSKYIGSSGNFVEPISLSICEIFLDLYLLADKYQVHGLIHYLDEQVDLYELDDHEVFLCLIPVVKNMHLPPLAAISKKLIRKCVEHVYFKQSDLLKLWSDTVEQNADVLSLLHAELKKFREEFNEPLCKNCRSSPCLDGQVVMDVWPGMRVSEYTAFEHKIEKVSTDPEDIEPFKPSISPNKSRSKTLRKMPESVIIKGCTYYYEQSEALSTSDERSFLVYRCA